MGKAASETREGFLEGREGDGGCTLGILGLLPSHWCVELGPEPSGGQGCVGPCPEAAVGSGGPKAALPPPH